MATPNDQLLQDALDAAVSRHFGTLFEVMMVEKDIEIAMQRFKNGLQKLADREKAVREMIKT